MGELLDEGDEVPQERIKQIMERYGFKEDEVQKTVIAYGK